MSEIIVLSDSDESVLNQNEEDVLQEDHDMNPIPNHNITDYDFPTVDFNFSATISNQPQSINLYKDNLYKEHLLLLDHENPSNAISEMKDYNFCKELYTHCMSDSSESTDENSHEMKEPPKKSNKKVTHQETKKNQKDDAKKLERLKNQEIIAKKKALKYVNSENAKNIKPGESIKFMEVLLDSNIKNYIFYDEIVKVLQNNEISFTIRSHSIKNCIIWNRNVRECYIDDKNEIKSSSAIKLEKYSLIIWYWPETIEKILDGTFCSSILSIKSSMPDYDISIIIYGVEKYFKNKKNLQKITKQQLEEALIDIQLMGNCKSRIIDSPEDLALLLYQYTKSIAEEPFKQEKNDKMVTEFDWYVVGDKKGTISIDKDGYGLRRLWQQQLCQFNLTSLEIAETICSAFPSPAALIQAYEKCTEEEGMQLLKDIPIRRTIGSLTNVRKIGSELSKKIYLMYTSKNGDTNLGTD